MSLISIAVIAGGLLVFSLVSGRLRGTMITPPLVFVMFGFVIGGEGLSIAEVNPEHSTIHLIAELTLILVLFSDAARMDLTRLLDAAVERGWAGDAFQGIGILSLALFTYVSAELIGGNGFIAAFLGGLVFGNTIRHPCSFLFEFMETEGQLLMLVTFLVFGAALLPEGLAHLTPATLLYAVLSLTVIRMLPVAISLVGAGLRPPTYLFLGWFGPRGLASILFVLLILEEAEVVHRDELLAITVVTVALSALLHGLTAAPLASRYAKLVARMGECEEIQPVPEMPLREGPPRAGASTVS